MLDLCLKGTSSLLSVETPRYRSKENRKGYRLRIPLIYTFDSMLYLL